MKRILCIAVLAAALPAGAQTIYKCPSAAGSTVLQQMPCTGGQLLDVRPSRAPAPAPQAAPQPQAGMQSGAANTAMERIEAERRINAVTAGMSAGYPVVGMTASQLNLAMGRPARVNSDDYGSVQKEQRVYERGNITYLVYVENGAVTAVQRRQGATSVRRVAQCNEQEIRNLEARATSISLSDSERIYYLRQVSEMRSRCR